MDSGEDKASSLHTWCNECAEVDRDELSDWVQQDRQQSHEWSEDPDGVEGNGSDGATPLQGNADTTAITHQLVEQVEAAVEALLGVGPHAKFN